MFEEAFVLALVKENWKYIEPESMAQTPDWLKNKHVESGVMEEAQLFNLATDKEEQHNLALTHPDKVKEMEQLLHSIKVKGNNQ
jgi:arylsulfatase A-like enzyme